MLLINKENLSYLFLLCFFSVLNATEFILFSYNRPLQLNALLESMATYLSKPENISVIYRAKSLSFEIAYEEIKDSYPKVKFYQQLNPPADFKELLINTIEKSDSNYICFAVDDIIITDHIDLHKCTRALEQTSAYGFYLRLGKNITYSYNYNIPLSLPSFTIIDDDIYQFRFEGKSYWAYPNTVDMTIYKKKDILPIFTELSYSSPNTLEREWHKKAHLKSVGLCFQHSKMINTPLNIVQDDWKNKNDSSYLSDDLLLIWQQGLKINIEPLHKVDNNSAHITYRPTFIKRDTNDN